MNINAVTPNSIKTQIKTVVAERAAAIERYITEVNDIIKNWGAIVNSIGDLSNSATIQTVKEKIEALSKKIDSSEFRTLQAAAGKTNVNEEKYVLASHWFKLTPDNFTTLETELKPKIDTVIEQEEAKFAAAEAAFNSQSADINRLQEELKKLLKSIKGTVTNNNVKLNVGQAPVKPNSVFKEFNLKKEINQTARSDASKLIPPNTSKIPKIQTTVASGTGSNNAAAKANAAATTAAKPNNAK